MGNHFLYIVHVGCQKLILCLILMQYKICSLYNRHPYSCVLGPNFWDSDTIDLFGRIKLRSVCPGRNDVLSGMHEVCRVLLHLVTFQYSRKLAQKPGSRSNVISFKRMEDQHIWKHLILSHNIVRWNCRIWRLVCCAYERKKNGEAVSQLSKFCNF